MNQLDNLITKYKIEEDIDITESHNNINRDDLDKIWSNIAKCFQHAANKSIPNKSIDDKSPEARNSKEC